MKATVRIASVLLGVGFGFMLSWGQMTSPDEIQQMLLLEDPYFYLMMASTIAVAFPGLRLLRRIRSRAVLVDEPIALVTDKPQRHHVVGAAIFGLGWAIAVTCPGPISAQLGQGYGWALVTMVGMVAGIWLGGRTVTTPERRAEPAAKAGVA